MLFKDNYLSLTYNGHQRNAFKSIMTKTNQSELFYQLDIDAILSACEAVGFEPSGGINTLNSMENRVYDIALNNDSHVIAKFYRPKRWSEAQILEEHQFLLELIDAEIPVIAPMTLHHQSLFKMANTDIYYSFFPKVGGRLMDELSEPQLEQLGRLLGRLHAIGKNQTAVNRPTLNPETYGLNNLNFLLSQKIIPKDIETAYKAAIERLVTLIEPLFVNTRMQRIHGDCHPANILWQDEQAFLLDFDDMVIGPPVQDLWLLTPGHDEEARLKRQIILSTYEEFCDFDITSLRLIEPLRALRYVHFATWLAKRHDDPAFKRTFPYYYQADFFHKELNDLEQQIQRIEKSI